MKPPHPFPARMAPELAIRAMDTLPVGSTVLDPMAGSGVVLRQALQHGHTAIGYDLDPLAELMSRVWTSYIPKGELVGYVSELTAEAKRRLGAISLRDLPWIDAETEAFIDFWFAEEQKCQVASLSSLLYEHGVRRIRSPKQALLNAAKLCLSRVIVTKSGGASLADDTSHSRPHRTRTSSDFDTFRGFETAAAKVDSVCAEVPTNGRVTVRLGDARDLRGIRSESVDAVITSPPYLNAIDYMRGHRLSLVWLGHTFRDLSSIRSSSIGAERAAQNTIKKADLEKLKAEMLDGENLTGRHIGMIERYITDLDRLASRLSRVIKPGGKATFVVGNSCLKGTFIKNSVCMKRVSERHGMRLVNEVERPLPENRRYLPVTAKTENALTKRMRTETVLTMEKAAR